MAEEAKETKETVDYADFSDMMGSEIPDEIEETPEDNQQSIDYFDNKETMEETEEETAEVETQPETPETNVKGETLSPDEERYWQHKFDTEAKPLKERNELLTQEIEKIKAQLNPPVKEEVLVAPVPPDSDDPLDMMNYLKAKDDYNTKAMAKQFETQNKYFQQLETERQTRVQEQQANAMKSYQLGKLQTVGGLTPEESMRALDEYSKASENEDDYFKKLADFHRFNTGQPTKSKPTKPQQTPPLAIQSGETQQKKVDEADEFFGDMNNFIKKNY